MDTATQTTTPPMGEPLPEGAIVYFDGICGFCNQTVNLLMKLDSRGKLRFAPLQGETARERLASQDIADLNTLIVSLNGRNYRRSAATVRILSQLGGFYKVLGTMVWLIPLPLRDLGYRLFSRYRYRVLGKLEACRLPTPEERGRLLP